MSEPNPLTVEDLRLLDVDGWNRLRADEPHRAVRLTGCELGDRHLAGIDLTEADLVDAVLRSVDLRDADLRGATLRGARLHDVTLDGVDLVGADLSSATLTDVSLVDADLRLADLTDARLVRCDLRGARVDGLVRAGLAVEGGQPGGLVGSRRTRVVLGALAVVLAVLMLLAVVALAGVELAPGTQGPPPPTGGEPPPPTPVPTSDPRPPVLPPLQLESTVLDESLRVGRATRVEVQLTLLPDDASDVTGPRRFAGDELRFDIEVTGRRPESFEVVAIDTTTSRSGPGVRLVVGEPASWSFDVTPRLAGQQTLNVRAVPYVVGTGERIGLTASTLPVVVEAAAAGVPIVAVVVLAVVLSLAVVAVALAVRRRRRPAQDDRRPVAHGQTVVFISYRRVDTAGWAGRIADRLALWVGDDGVFIDVDDIPKGESFLSVILTALARSDSVVVLIGPRWAGDGSSRSLEDPADYVRRELETALELGVRVLPVLVDGAVMPDPDELPESIRRVATINAVSIHAGDFDEDIEDLLDALARTTGRPERAPS